MADKQRGDVEYFYRQNHIRDLTGYEPIQFYQVYECERHMTKAPETPLFPEGLLLLYCMSGAGDLQINGQTVSLAQDTAVVWPAGAETILNVTDQQIVQYICINFSVSSIKNTVLPEALCWYFENITDVRMTENGASLRPLLSQFLGELSLPQPVMSLAKGMFYQILIILYRILTAHMAHTAVTEPTVNAVGHTVYAIIRYVDDHLCSMNNLASMAQELGYSYNYLSHLFRRKTGMTIQAYVSRKKIEKSVELLSEGELSITEIAALLNYDCIQSFSKAFKRAMNMSPTEYRALQEMRR